MLELSRGYAAQWFLRGKISENIYDFLKQCSITVVEKSWCYPLRDVSILLGSDEDYVIRMCEYLQKKGITIK